MEREDINRLYDRHARELVGFFVRRTGDPQLALDLFSETFLAAFEQRDRCRARDDQREAIQLRMVDERGYGAVSEVLEISEPAARARVSRGLRALRRASASPRGSGE